MTYPPLVHRVIHSCDIEKIGYQQFYPHYPQKNIQHAHNMWTGCIFS